MVPILKFCRNLALSAVVFCPSVSTPGLSHVTEEIEEESIVPSCALELGSQGDFCVGMNAGDIEGEALQDGEVGWGIVLSIARQFLVEHAIDRPMHAIVHGPVCAHDAHDIL